MPGRVATRRFDRSGRQSDCDKFANRTTGSCDRALEGIGAKADALRTDRGHVLVVDMAEHALHPLTQASCVVLAYGLTYARREELEQEQLRSLRTELHSYSPNGPGINKIVRTTSATLTLRLTLRANRLSLDAALEPLGVSDGH